MSRPRSGSIRLTTKFLESMTSGEVKCMSREEKGRVVRQLDVVGTTISWDVYLALQGEIISPEVLMGLSRDRYVPSTPAMPRSGSIRLTAKFLGSMTAEEVDLMTDEKRAKVRQRLYKEGIKVSRQVSFALQGVSRYEYRRDDDHHSRPSCDDCDDPCVPSCGPYE